MIRDFYSLGMILQGCIFRDENILVSLNKEIILSEEGSKFFSSYDDVKDRVEFVGYTALLMLYRKHKLLINIEETDLISLERILNKALQQKKILLPWQFDNELYNKYYNTIKIQKTSLDYETTVDFLNETSVGVYHSGKYIVGPWGLIETSVLRPLTPYNSYKLWHCPDVYCEAFHNVSFTGFSNKHQEGEICKLFKNFVNKKTDEFYKEFLENVLPKSDSFDANKYNQMPIFLGNCFSEEEIRVIFEAALENNKRMRSLLPNRKRLKGSSQQISTQINKNEIYQLLLILDNDELATIIDICVVEGNLKIPETELRFSKLTNSRLSRSLKGNIELSKYGIRIKHHKDSFALARFIDVIKTVFGTVELQNKLDWLLCNQFGINFKPNRGYQIFESLIYTEDVNLIANVILFSDVSILKSALLALSNGYCGDEYETSNKELILNRILWKCGFNLPLYREDDLEIRNLLKDFSTKVNELKDFTELDKREIRSKSINFFVEFEEFIQSSLFLLTWTLFQEHSVNTKFVYSKLYAAEFSKSFLSNHVFLSGEILELDENGDDTLYPLLQGFKALTEKADNIYSEKDKYLKKPNRLPWGYDSKIFYYPFKHELLVCDLSVEVFEDCKMEINGIYQGLTNSNLLGIRNSTSHKRKVDKFPSMKSFNDFFDIIEKIIDKIIDLGLFPVVYNSTSLSLDRYGRKVVYLKDFENNRFNYYSSENDYYPKPFFRDPHIVVPLVKLRGFDKGLIFTLREKSSYTDMWTDFPKKLLSENQTK